MATTMELNVPVARVWLLGIVRGWTRRSETQWHRLQRSNLSTDDELQQATLYRTSPSLFS